MKSNMRTEGSRNNGNRQTETYDHGNVTAGGHGSRDKESGPVRQAGGRKYKQGIPKDTGPMKMTSDKFWTGKEKDMQSWLEEMEELDTLDCMQAKGSQESILLYV